MEQTAPHVPFPRQPVLHKMQGKRVGCNMEVDSGEEGIGGNLTQAEMALALAG